MTEEMILIPKRVIKMITMEGFIEAFESLKKTNITQVDAYEQCEELYEKYFGRRRYSEFQSFYMAKQRKKRKK
jgi:hypothetical protein